MYRIRLGDTEHLVPPCRALNLVNSGLAELIGDEEEAHKLLSDAYAQAQRMLADEVVEPGPSLRAAIEYQPLGGDR